MENSKLNKTSSQTAQMTPRQASLVQGFSPTRHQTEREEEFISDEKLQRVRNEILNINGELDSAISGLNETLDKKLKKQEHDYLKGYSMYVKQKESDLRKIITELNEKN